MLNNVGNSFITLITLTSFIIFFVIYKVSNSENLKIFLDTDFDKPQAFHSSPVPRAGGFASIIALTLLFSTFNFFFNLEILSYIYFSILFFTLGFVEDIKINSNPSVRLILMVLILSIGFFLFDIEITKTGLLFLNQWLQNSLFQYFFLLLCFLFVINGCNLIDGFNGLLATQLIIINSILLFIHLENSSLEYAFLIFGQISILFIFLLFNFPSAKMFFGDSGAYLFGAITSLNVINTSVSFDKISPFFFAILLFYLFFEVFFSFIRKIKMDKSPLKPDKFHLHMLIFDYLRNKDKKYSHALVTVYINTTYFLCIYPAIYFKQEALFCRYWLILLILFYIYFYNFYSNHIKKDENY